ncbi:hypothetical protein GCM10018781_02280 [Kitasatospora indigofera]|uniref:Uncharacterized protein n=1 Tax=Kitasatospora indigofera TaxID=67307 RepID=A0A919FAV0_9ACTN|nr:hypothetical protein GCM10018781_02280 [Kitasatospora indigofera]
MGKRPVVWSPTQVSRSCVRTRRGGGRSAAATHRNAASTPGGPGRTCIADLTAVKTRWGLSVDGREAEAL